VSLSDDDPLWEQHDGGNLHRDFPEWSAADGSLAEAFYVTTRGRARAFLDVLMDRPGEQLNADIVADQVVGQELTGPARHMVARTLRDMGAAQAASGRRLPFYWWRGRHGAPTRYAMKASVAALFRQAQLAASESQTTRSARGPSTPGASGLHEYKAWSFLSLARTARLGSGEAAYPDELGVRYVFDSTVANHGSVRVGDLAVIRDAESVLGAGWIDSIQENQGHKIRNRCPSCRSTDFKFRLRTEPRFRCATCGAGFDAAESEAISVVVYTADYGRTFWKADARIPASELTDAYMSRASQHSIRRLDATLLRSVLDRYEPLGDSWWSLGSIRDEPPGDRSLVNEDDGSLAVRQGRESLRWTREEDVLALDLFVSAGVVNGGRFLGRNDPRVIALSQELRAMPTHPGVQRDEKFRNPSGVELKLMNFRAVERVVKLEFGFPGAEDLPGGTPRYGALDRAIFEEYLSRDFRGLADDAEAIRSAATEVREPVTKVIAEDRPVEDARTAAYEAAGAEGGTRSRSEHALVRRYADWLTASGLKVVSRLYRVPGLARPFLCDVFLPDRNALIEAKSSDCREAIRMAIGQLLDYKYLQGTDPQLAVLLPHEPSPEVLDLLDAMGIAAIWPSQEGFRDSVSGALTRT
jgi:transposase-like protein